MKQGCFRSKFVETIPEPLEEGVLYVSMRYGMAMHKCPCGCGRDVATPLSPTDWQLFFDGRQVSLDPSIGNWNFPCRSHYWIRGGAVDWAEDMSKYEIERGRGRSRAHKHMYYSGQMQVKDVLPKPEAPVSVPAPRTEKMPSRWDKFISFLIGKPPTNQP